MKKKIVAIVTSGERLYVLLESGKLYACTDDGSGGEIGWEEMPHPEDDDEERE